ncbi:GTP-binding protein GEM isoform X3 [Bos javanicus]|uniref:GTP-binding protein GEM isoform X3 n=1 Tax=Bos javanicus TaxID=9906 RepID=UPI002AA745A7|nr:GTP-binding protein GEM isoform X3 [Bos javanicus]XP_061295344.1 GTP-binding protein GEM isoform X3 [Bos javanicus]
MSPCARARRACSRSSSAGASPPTAGISWSRRSPSSTASAAVPLPPPRTPAAGAGPPTLRIQSSPLSPETPTIGWFSSGSRGWASPLWPTSLRGSMTAWTATAKCLEGESEWLQDHCMQVGDAYLIVYSITDRASFEKASELRIQLRRARQTEDIPIILVGNKSDLVRCREVSVSEGRACAVVFDCKFIETSAAVQHNVKELFEGIVRQVRLRRDSKEKNERRLAYQKRRESIPRKARRFWGKIVAKNNKNMAFKLKSKSCHDLSVL